MLRFSYPDCCTSCTPASVSRCTVSACRAVSSLRVGSVARESDMCPDISPGRERTQGWPGGHRERELRSRADHLAKTVTCSTMDQAVPRDVTPGDEESR